MAKLSDIVDVEIKKTATSMKDAKWNTEKAFYPILKVLEGKTEEEIEEFWKEVAEFLGEEIE
jgi:hypothetical protein